MNESDDKEPIQPQLVVNQEKLQALVREMRSKQSLPLAILGGLGASLVGALIWAGITVATGYQIGWMAVGVGFLVGYAVRWAGKGIDKSFGVVGAVFALLGCLLGNLFSFVGVISSMEGMPYMEVLSQLDLDLALRLYQTTFSPMDVLFYGIALYEGYKLSLLRMTQEQSARVLDEVSR